MTRLYYLFLFSAQKPGIRIRLRILLENREAVVHIIDQDNVEAANLTSAALEADKSELDIYDFFNNDSQMIRVPGVNEAKVRYETELYDSMGIYNDQNKPTADLLLLKVKHYHIDESIYQNGYIDPSETEASGKAPGIITLEVGRIPLKSLQLIEAVNEHSSWNR